MGKITLRKLKHKNNYIYKSLFYIPHFFVSYYIFKLAFKSVSKKIGKLLIKTGFYCLLLSVFY